ncbi:hypothetical protein ACQKWADRAFT_326711 [Trichoderma austrokoningii]
MWVMAMLVLFFNSLCLAQPGEHIDWPRWCGKAYLPQYPDFNPGGQTLPPTKHDKKKLNLRVKPRYNIFLTDENEGEFFMHFEASLYHGFSWPYVEGEIDPINGHRWPPKVDFAITNPVSGDILVQDMLMMGEAMYNTTSDHPIFRFKFNLGKFKPRLEPYEVILNATAREDKWGDNFSRYNFRITTEIYVLPSKSNGSIVRIDNLFGRLFRRSRQGEEFKPFFPYGFYAPCQGLLCGENKAANIQSYRGHGLNSIVPVMDSSVTSRDVYKSLDSLGMTYMYDLRQDYKNHTAVSEQVEAIKDSDGLYAYWTFDQPDAHSEVHARMRKAGSLIKKLDPYHPIAASLGCDDYYFGEYSNTADIIVANVHPIGASTSRWHTDCNATYGNCGCDNCKGNVADVAARLEKWAQHERLLNRWPKPKMLSLQVSPDGENHLPAKPSGDEIVAMSALALGHGAKGILPWAWPVDNETLVFHNKFARVMNNSVVKDVLAMIPPKKVKVEKHEELDVSYWVSNRTLLLSVVNLGKEYIQGPVTIDIPFVQPTKITSFLWGRAAWDHRELMKPFGMKLRILAADPLSTNIILGMVCCDAGPSHSEEYDLA